MPVGFLFCTYMPGNQFSVTTLPILLNHSGVGCGIVGLRVHEDIHVSKSEPSRSTGVAILENLKEVGSRGDLRPLVP